MVFPDLPSTKALTALARRIGAQTNRPLDREDLVQEGRLAALEAHKRWNGRDPFATFVYRRVHGAMIDTIRNWHPVRRVTGTSRIEWAPLSTDSRPDGAPSPEALCLHTRVRDALSTLPVSHRAVLIDYYWNGSTDAEIATIIGVTKSAVTQRRHAGLQQLREILT